MGPCRAPARSWARAGAPARRSSPGTAFAVRPSSPIRPRLSPRRSSARVSSSTMYWRRLSIDLRMSRDTCICEMPMRAATCVCVMPSKKRRCRMSRSRGSRLLHGRSQDPALLEDLVRFFFRAQAVEQLQRLVLVVGPRRRRWRPSCRPARSPALRPLLPRWPRWPRPARRWWASGAAPPSSCSITRFSRTLRSCRARGTLTAQPLSRK